jgi:hypothetical protein
MIFSLTERTHLRAFQQRPAPLGLPPPVINIDLETSSRLFIYHNKRQIKATVDRDYDSILRDWIKASWKYIRSGPAA